MKMFLSIPVIFIIIGNISPIQEDDILCETEEVSPIRPFPNADVVQTIMFVVHLN